MQTHIYIYIYIYDSACGSGDLKTLEKELYVCLDDFDFKQVL